MSKPSSRSRQPAPRGPEPAPRGPQPASRDPQPASRVPHPAPRVQPPPLPHRDPHIERWLGLVAAITAGVVIVLVASSTLINRKVAWTSGRAAASPARAARHTYADSEALFAAVDRYAERQMRAGQVPGFTFALVHGQQVVHTRAFGVANPEGRHVTPHTAFILGSLTKSFTALAIMQLVEQRRVALDAPVQRYLPWFTVRDRRASAQITVRELLNHTSGIPKSAGLQIVRGEKATTRAQQAALLSDVRLAHVPATAFEYSNANYWLLGLIIETVSGTAYGTYVQQHVFAPLGMTHSFTSETEAYRHDFARGYRIWFGRPRAEDLPFYRRELAVGYLISSADDMARYLVAQLNGGSVDGQSVLTADALRQMQTPPPGMPYGMGWLTDNVDGVPVLWHTGAVANYHGDMLLIPSLGWGAVWLANTNNFALEDELSDGIKGIAAILTGYEPPPPPRPSFRTKYALILLACLSWVAWRIGQVIELRRWHRAPNRAESATRAAPAADGAAPEQKKLAGALIDPGLSLGLFIGAPLALGTPLSTLRWFAPDVTHWLIVNAIVAMLIMVQRVVLWSSGAGSGTRGAGRATRDAGRGTWDVGAVSGARGHE